MTIGIFLAQLFFTLIGGIIGMFIGIWMFNKFMD